MSISSKQPCPKCKRFPDIPDDLICSMWSSDPFFCNRCGAKLEVYFGKLPTETEWENAARGTVPHGPYISLSELEDAQGYRQGMFWLRLLLQFGSEQSLLLRDIPSDLTDNLHIDFWHDPRTKLFLSYSHENLTWARGFASALRREGWNLFFDEASIERSANWFSAIGQAIEDCHFYMIILTPESWTSEWVQRELTTAFAAHKEVIPLLLENVTVTGLLRAVQWIDVRGKSPEEAKDIVSQSLPNKPESN